MEGREKRSVCVGLTEQLCCFGAKSVVFHTQNVVFSKNRLVLFNSFTLLYLVQHLSLLNVSCYDNFTIILDDGTPVEDVCFYRGQQKKIDTCEYENTIDFWRNLSINLAWVIGIILIMFAINSAIQKWIPKQPRDIVVKVKKEAHYRRVILNKNVRIQIEKISKNTRKQQKDIKIVLAKRREEERELVKAREVAVNLTSF